MRPIYSAVWKGRREKGREGIDTESTCRGYSTIMGYAEKLAREKRTTEEEGARIAREGWTEEFVQYIHTLRTPSRFFSFFSLLATLPLLPLAFCLVCLRFVCATNKQKIANVFWPFRQGLKSEKKEQEDVSFFWRGWSHWYCFYWCLMLPANQHARRWPSEKKNKVVSERTDNLVSFV